MVSVRLTRERGAVAGKGKKIKEKKLRHVSASKMITTCMSFSGAQMLKSCECPWVLVFMDLLSVAVIIGASHLEVNKRYLLNLDDEQIFWDS